jgi:hypothetical protein
LINKISPRPIQDIVQLSNKIAKCIHSLLEKNPIDRPKSVIELKSILNK